MKSSDKKASTSTKDRRQGDRRKAATVKLTRIKQFYYVVDAESYKALATLGVAVTRLHKNMVPTLNLLNSNSEKIKIVGMDFYEEIMYPFLERLSEKWNSKAGRKATIKNSTLVFEVTDKDLIAESKEKLAQIEASLERFFTRWSFLGTFEYSEKPNKSKLHVKYGWDAGRNPVIPLVEDSDALPTMMWELGFLRLVFKLGERMVEIQVQQAAGSQWKPVITTRTTYSAIKDPRPFIKASMMMANKNLEIFDKPTES